MLTENKNQMKFFLIALLFCFSFANALAKEVIVVDSKFVKSAVMDLFPGKYDFHELFSVGDSCHSSYIFKPSDVEIVKSARYYIGIQEIQEHTNYTNVNACKDLQHIWLSSKCTAKTYNNIIKLLQNHLSEQEVLHAKNIVKKIQNITKGRKINKTYLIDHDFKKDLEYDGIIKIAGVIFGKSGEVLPSMMQKLQNEESNIIISQDLPEKLMQNVNKNSRIYKIDIEFQNEYIDSRCIYCDYIHNVYKDIE